jgi:pyruvate/2-oxoacid:ferredoxin oxidoreductase beta subunit
VHALDATLQHMKVTRDQVAIVSDIGCSGLLDTFFNTHAFHGLHGRALTYATGIKMARPNLTVIVTMGDGGLGIGGAHLLSTCRRNIDLTLLVLNNFNYGMTGGQCSATTPSEARVGSGFLNRLEIPVDVCQVAGAAGAGQVARASVYQKDLAEQIETAIRFEGFSLIDIWGICPGRYTRKNKLSPKIIETQLSQLPPTEELTTGNARKEYGRHYREEAGLQSPAAPPTTIDARFTPPESGRQGVVLLGSAGQRIVTAGEILCLSGITAGLFASQKNDYPITVLRGHSVSEVILSEENIGYTGIETPSVVIAMAQEGVNRRRQMFDRLAADTLVLSAVDIDLPTCSCPVVKVDFNLHKIKFQDRALAALAILAVREKVLSTEMLTAALGLRFEGKVAEAALSLVKKAAAVAAGE